jgi:hypothetical protein
MAIGIKVSNLTQQDVIDGDVNIHVIKNIDGTPTSFKTNVDNFLYPNSITSDKISTNAITADKIAANSITSDQIAANSITSDQIAANSITTDQLAANTITTDQIAANAITATQIAACSITATQIAACSITATKIAACSIGATQIQSGAITAQALASNIVITGSVQSRNFDGFNRVDQTGEEILQYLDAGTQGFFLDERTGTAVFTDIIARDNIIAANYIKYNENSGLSAIDANGNFGINLDNDTLQIEDGRVKIKQIPSNAVIDISLYTSPNTIFFGQSETQTFELPTLNQPMNFMGNYFDASTWVLSSTVMNYPQLAQVGDDVTTDQWSGSNRLSYGNQNHYAGKIQLFNSNDERAVGIYKSPYLRSSIYDNLEPVGSSVSDNSVDCEVVVLHVDLHDYVDSADAISGTIELNNVKFLIDTSHISHLTNVKDYNFAGLKAYFSSTSGAMTDTYTSTVNFRYVSQIKSAVINPTLLADIYEAEVDMSFGSIATGNNTRYMTVVLNTSVLNYADYQTTYLGYVPISAQFTPETNLRFEYYGALPEVLNHNLSDINCLIPGKQKLLADLTQLEFTQNPTNPTGGPSAIIPFEWSSDTRHQLGHPEVDPDRDGPLVDPVTNLLNGTSWRNAPISNP